MAAARSGDATWTASATSSAASVCPASRRSTIGMRGSSGAAADGAAPRAATSPVATIAGAARRRGSSTGINADTLSRCAPSRWSFSSIRS